MDLRALTNLHHLLNLWQSLRGNLHEARGLLQDDAGARVGAGEAQQKRDVHGRGQVALDDELRKPRAQKFGRDVREHIGAVTSEGVGDVKRAAHDRVGGACTKQARVAAQVRAHAAPHRGVEKPAARAGHGEVAQQAEHIVNNAQTRVVRRVDGQKLCEHEVNALCDGTATPALAQGAQRHEIECALHEHAGVPAVEHSTRGLLPRGHAEGGAHDAHLVVVVEAVGEAVQNNVESRDVDAGRGAGVGNNVHGQARDGEAERAGDAVHVAEDSDLPLKVEVGARPRALRGDKARCCQPAKRLEVARPRVRGRDGRGAVVDLFFLCVG